MVSHFLKLFRWRVLATKASVALSFLEGEATVVIAIGDLELLADTVSQYIYRLSIELPFDGMVKSDGEEESEESEKHSFGRI